MQEMNDVTGAEIVQVSVSYDGKTLWVNTEKGCALRICRIKQLIIEDARHTRSLARA